MYRKIILILAVLGLVFAVSASAEQGWTEISDIEGLRSIAEDPSGRYRLTADIDMAGEDWIPVALDGEFDGAGHALLNLHVTQPGPNRFTSLDGNYKKYDTGGAALFDRCMGAFIHDLTIYGAVIDVETEDPIFCSVLMGGALDAIIKDCSIYGSVRLKSGAKMVGVAGIGGFMSGDVRDCDVTVELIYEDTNKKEECEEFAGAVIACGYADIYGCEIDTYIYTSVFGYVHNGGIIGMYSKGALKHTTALLRNNKAGCTINFFEKSPSRRAYAYPYVGEELNTGIKYERNTKVRFHRNETKDYSKPIYPCTCSAEPTLTVIEPTAQEYGYTVSACPTCGYTYRKDYTLRRNGLDMPE